MQPQNFSKIKKISMMAVIIILCSTILYLVTTFLLFPKEIKILAGVENSLNFKIPIKADIESENVAVLNVNSKPVENNIKVDLSNQFSIEVNEIASINMKLNFLGIPIKTVKVESLPDLEVIPCGMTVGVSIETDGILVLGTGYVNAEDGTTVQPANNILKSGDLIREANGVVLHSKEELEKIVEESKDVVKLLVRRRDEDLKLEIVPVKSMDDQKNRIGVWTRNDTQGIGTVTYYNPETRRFAALGHGIVDVDTKTLMSLKQGKISSSNIISVKKGKKGSPGELTGEIEKSNILGDVTINNSYGIYGMINEDAISKMPEERMKIALQGEVKEGAAVIRSNIDGKEIKEFTVNIESINRYSNDDSKGMVIKITDQALLDSTNGIVQGMSGSPIIQDGKLIGAVTHVFVQDPSKGYGIFIENMLKQN